MSTPVPTEEQLGFFSLTRSNFRLLYALFLSHGPVTSAAASDHSGASEEEMERRGFINRVGANGQQLLELTKLGVAFVMAVKAVVEAGL